jgi:hypothetical protein
MDLPTTIQVAKDLSLIGLGVSGAIVAWIGLTAWKRRLKGTDRYKLALKAIRAIYEVRDQVRSCKSRLWSSVEADDRKRSEGESQEERQHLDLLHLYFKRLDRVLASMSDLDTIRLELLAMFGEEAEDWILPFRSVVRGIHADAAVYFMLPWYDRSTPEGMKYHNKLFGEPPVELDEAINAAERVLRRYIK